MAGTTASVRKTAVDAGSAGFMDWGSGVQVSTPISPSGGSSIVIWVASLDVATGTALAATRFGAPSGGVQTVRQVACDAAGNLLLAGAFKGVATVGDSKLSAGSVQNALLVKLDAQLAPRWVRNWVGAGDSVLGLVAVESTGSLLVAGSYIRGLSVDKIALALGQGSLTSAFVARVDSTSGAVVAARGYGIPGGSQSLFGLRGTPLSDGPTWMAGMFTQTLQLGPPAADLSAAADTVFLGLIAP